MRASRRSPLVDARRRDWSWFDHGVFGRGFSTQAIAVYMFLVRRADSSGACYPGIPDIARNTGMGATSARKAIRELEKGGAISVEPRTHPNGHPTSNRYVLLDLRVGGGGGSPGEPGGSPGDAEVRSSLSKEQFSFTEEAILAKPSPFPLGRDKDEQDQDEQFMTAFRARPDHGLLNAKMDEWLSKHPGRGKNPRFIKRWIENEAAEARAMSLPVERAISPQGAQTLANLHEWVATRAAGE